eukprot:4970989-Alexandrium_andersonii.AAC.1
MADQLEAAIFLLVGLPGTPVARSGRGRSIEEEPRIACPPFRPAFAQHIIDEPWACCPDNASCCTSASG